jgi:hypothetical protein
MKKQNTFKLDKGSSNLNLLKVVPSNLSSRNIIGRVGSFISKKVKEKKEIDYKMKYIAMREDLIGLLCSFHKKPYECSL